MLPRRVPKAAKRASRWKSTAHRDFVRSFACAMCGATTLREAAHVRMNSGAGAGQKPDDWRVVPLCVSTSDHLGCHNHQHALGEPSFWAAYAKKHGQTVEQLITEFIKASPRRHQIEQVQRERGDSLTSARAASR
jgi:hypothetical protein